MTDDDYPIKRTFGKHKLEVYSDNALLTVDHGPRNGELLIDYNHATDEIDISSMDEEASIRIPLEPLLAFLAEVERVRVKT
jgi:hypothetical protein